MLKLICVIVFLVESTQGARILGIVPTPSYSHQVVFRPIWKELAKRGHDLVVMTTDPMKDVDDLPNLRQIDWGHAYKIWREEHNFSKMLEENKYNFYKIFKAANEMFADISEYQLNHPEVKVILQNKTEHFDLLIVEYLVPTMYAFSHRFKCPFIGVTSLDMPLAAHSYLGNPSHPILYPDFMLPFDGDLNFFERVLTVVLSAVLELFTKIVGFNNKYTDVLKYFGDDVPFIFDIMRNVSMVFLNVDPTFHKRPLGPATIAIGGGTHLEGPKPLPFDIKEFLDSGNNGVIYLSFGTNVNETDVKPHLRKALINTLKKLPYKVLWKFGVEVADQPENVKIVKWMSQQDVLRHPNIKCFITQGGLQSMEEAIFTHVPLVGIPFFGDQEMNVKKMANRGIGLALDRDTITEEQLTEAINEVINNSKYKNKMIEISNLSRDVQFTGLEKAIWWTEYVLRHKGAKHLRNPAMDVPNYQYFMLDIISFFIISISIISFIVCKVIKFIYKLLRSKTKTKAD